MVSTLRDRGGVVNFKMDSNVRLERDTESYESIFEDIDMLKKELHDQIVIHIRHEVGDIQDLDDIQVFCKFWRIFLRLLDSIMPAKSSWPILFLDVFMPISDKWSTKLRLEKAMQFHDFITEVENSLNANEPCDNEIGYPKNDNECDESVDNDITSSECEDEKSQICESEDSNQKLDDMHDVDFFFNDDVCEEESNNISRGLSSCNVNECAKILVVEVLSKEEDVCND